MVTTLGKWFCLLATVFIVAQGLPIGSDSNSRDELWQPETGSREEWLRCHGFSCAEWNRTRLLLVDMKLASLPELFDHEQINETNLLQDDSLDNCIWLTVDQIKEVMAQKEKEVESVSNREVDHSHSRQKRQIEDFETNAFRKWSFPVHWKFDGKHDSAQRDVIRGAFRHWEAKTCVRFQELGVQQDYNSYHILVTAESTGCHSYIGRITHWPQQLNLQSGCVNAFGIPVHEIGHALGLWHEQQRPDRDDHIRINWDNLGFFPGQFYKNTLTKNLGVEYDVGSVMHYAQFDGAADPSKPVMETLDPLYQRNMGQRTGLSFKDAKLINRAYCGDVCPNPLEGPCLRGGYQDPNDCTRCRCPDGFGGTYCHLAAAAVNDPEQCGGEIVARATDQYIQSPGYATVGHYQSYQQCSWLVRAPSGHAVRLEFEGEFGVYCYYSQQCHHWVEVRYKGALNTQGPRFCCDKRPESVLVSEGQEMTIVFRSNWTQPSETLRRGFRARINAVRVEGPSYNTSTTQKFTTTTITSTTPTTTTTPRPTPTPTHKPTPTPTSTMIPTTSPTTGTDKRCSRVDLTFILDSSGSVMKSNWLKVLSWVKSIVRLFPPVGQEGTQVALVTFGNEGTRHFRLGEHTDLESLFVAISIVPFKDERTNTADGISVMRNEVYRASSARPNARKVALLMTDNEASINIENTLPEAAASRNVGIEMYVVGVGGDFNTFEAEAITADKTRVFYLENFDELKSDKETSNIYQTLCTDRRTTVTLPGGTPAPPKLPAWECDFEEPVGVLSQCGMTQDTRDNFDWWPLSGATPSEPTGPSAAASGEWYMYIEASDKAGQPRHKGDIARMFVPVLDVSGPVCVSFEYHMYGFHVGSLEVGLTRDGATTRGWYKENEKGNKWLHAECDVELGKGQKITFTATRGGEFSGDIAIDDIQVHTGSCRR